MSHDLPILSRRRALGLLAGAGALAVVGCSGDDGAGAAATTTGDTTSTTGATATAVDEIPDETAGPYPGDGTNGPNVLAEDGVVREDITTSFGSSTGTADGVPLRIELTILDAATDQPLPGAAVYLWHCDREGRYSMYSSGAEDQNYLRGVQVADDAGDLAFASIFPGAYDGRWPHVHFEVYAGVDDATGGGRPVKTSQLALPEDVCATVYASSGYEASAQNLARTSLDSDTIFSDGVDDQLAAMTGSVADGLVARLAVGI
jgi:protocatechuate 3,4-dioxygenase beta subunit